MAYQIKSIKVSDITHKHLTRMGRKGESYDSIIAGLVKMALAIEMQEDIKKIHTLCGDADANQMDFDDIVAKAQEIFTEIGFDYGIYPDWELSKAMETAMDEDMVGMIREHTVLPLSEVVINCYCNYLEMPSPTTGLGAMIPPLAPH